MKCVKCDSEMIPAVLTGSSMYPLLLKNKRKWLLDSDIKVEVLCYMCTECGYIELYAKDPKAIARN